MRLDNELERAVHDWLEATVVEPPRTVLAAALERVEETPQQRHRWLGRWFGRGGGAVRSAGDHGGDSDSHTGRNRLMFSLTTVAASLAALALAAALVVPGADPGSQLAPGAEGAATHIVAADGSGDFRTIGEAVAAAVDGDTILVRPGEYAEALVVDKDITLQGDGTREDIVITFREGAAATDMEGLDVYIPVVLRGFDGTFAGMTVRAPAEGGAVLVDGGAPLLQDLWMTVDPGSYGTLAMGGVSQPVVRDSLLEGYVLTDSDGTSPLMEGNTFTQVPVGLSGPGESTLRGNTFAEGSGISASEDLTGLIEGNTFIGGQPGMPSELGLGIKAGSDLVVRGNTFSDLDIGISVDAYAAATIEGNEFDDDGMAVTWGSTKGGSISDNTIRGGFAGITVSGGSPSITGNTIEDVTGRGLAVGVRANATVEGNSICGCGTNLVVDEASDSQVGENDVCTEGGAG